MAKDFKTSIGGQALIEGIMMVGPEKTAVVVRAPQEESGFAVKLEENKATKENYPILGVPFLRGAVSFFLTMVRGVRALMFSADYYPEEEGVQDEAPSKLDLWLEKKLGSEGAMNVVVYIAAILGIAMSVGLFFVIPTLIGGLFRGFGWPFWLRNILEGVLRIAIFMVYLIAVSRMSDMKRVFSYHGAEHKTIACYEAGLPLTVENVRTCSRFHPRCGTSFMFVVMVVSILVFSVVRVDSTWLRLLVRLLTLPIVVGITYEINRYVGRHDNTLTRVFTKPGLWMQNFTTNEPDDSMIEVGIQAFTMVLPEEQEKHTW